MHLPLDTQSSTLTPILAGPILRKLETHCCHIWLATSAPYDLIIDLFDEHHPFSSDTSSQRIKVGKKLFLHFITVHTEQEIEELTPYSYSIKLLDPITGETISGQLDELCYDSETLPTFIRKTRIDSLLHGSCRKAHYGYKNLNERHHIGDGLAQADKWVETVPIDERPALLMLSGDQIYADDVAGPMLSAIRQAITILEIDEESLPDREHDLNHDPLYYHREALLPQNQESEAIYQQFFKGKRKPVFTTDTAHNHLISLAEILCMYLLVWSPNLWKSISLNIPSSIQNEDDQSRYLKEQKALEEFVTQLHRTQRVLAHLPTAMIFDDHDVTDDWNLTAEWEQTAYEHPLSKRIIGNAIFGYFLCQGWGNSPSTFDQSFFHDAQVAIEDNHNDTKDVFIDRLLKFDQWHYEWDTAPKLVVLDTRTHRWRSEKGLNHPSGLMDWEAITDLQQEIKDLDSVILVSPAPIFGVKLIETVQAIFAWCGKPLMVDAENWMAHPGSAYALINLFTHPKTPNNFIILSGDVHYSFVYDVQLRGHKSSPNIWQITSSGQRNEFPHRLLDWFDRLNRWLYAPWSPLNIFTKRRTLHISPRKPENANRGERLLNQSGIGLVSINKQGKPVEISQLCNNNQKVKFKRSKT